MTRIIAFCGIGIAIFLTPAIAQSPSYPFGHLGVGNDQPEKDCSYPTSVAERINSQLSRETRPIVSVSPYTDGAQREAEAARARGERWSPEQPLNDKQWVAQLRRESLADWNRPNWLFTREVDEFEGTSLLSATFRSPRHDFGPDAFYPEFQVSCNGGEAMVQLESAGTFSLHVESVKVRLKVDQDPISEMYWETHRTGSYLIGRIQNNTCYTKGLSIAGDKASSFISEVHDAESIAFRYDFNESFAETKQATIWIDLSDEARDTISEMASSCPEL